MFHTSSIIMRCIKKKMCALCQNKKFLNLRIKTEPVTDGAEAMVSVRLFIYIYEYRAQTTEIWIGPVHMLQTRQAWFLS